MAKEKAAAKSAPAKAPATGKAPGGHPFGGSTLAHRPERKSRDKLRVTRKETEE